MLCYHLKYFNFNNILNRDYRPANILLSYISLDNEEYRLVKVMLSDFGFARNLNSKVFFN